MTNTLDFHLPPLLTAFLLTLGTSFLLGLGLREYYLANRKRLVFGSTRTSMLMGILGFSLWELGQGWALYLGGLGVFGVWLALFYRHKLSQSQTGLLGMMLALVSYTLGPISLMMPYWFLLLYVISALFILNARDNIQLLTERLANQELITLAKFLVLSGVILPLTSKEPIASFLPVSMHKTWLAVVVVSGISYLSYLLQTYFIRKRGILVTGALAGLYSSTAASLVLARQSASQTHLGARAAAGVVLATAMMYLRLELIVLFFNAPLALELAPAMLGLFLLTILMTLVLARLQSRAENGVDESFQKTRNPLELTSAIFFAGSYLFVTILTGYLIKTFPTTGLHWMAFLTGFTDIDPFVIAIVSNGLSPSLSATGKAILIAASSNNLLKAFYVFLLGKGMTRWTAPLSLLLLSGAGLGLVWFG